MKRINLLLALLFSSLTLWGHPWKPSHYVIIDTDGGLDDMKAICMFLASPDVRVMGITVSDGFKKEEEAYTAIRNMLDAFHHEGLEVVRSDRSIPFITRLLKEESTPVEFISLGTLRTASEAVTNIPIFRTKVKKIVWTNSGLPGENGFNYKADPEAAGRILSDTIPVMVTGGNAEDFYDENTLTALAAVNTRYATRVREIIEKNSNHSFVFSAFDELAPLLLHYPSLFEKSQSGPHFFYKPVMKEQLRTSAIKILAGTNIKKMQVFNEIPTDTSLYMPDIQPYIADIIQKHGPDEWTSGVIANELHRHLGVFAIVGVKMGIRAREYFCTGVDEFHVLSHAGSMPPLSCMNDGIQVSTGATPGHGLLTVSADEPFSPSAEFSYKGRTIKVTLKKEFADKLSSELKEINFIYGLDSNIYWEMVRKNSIRYWLLLDRNDIFEISSLN